MHRTTSGALVLAAALALRASTAAAQAGTLDHLFCFDVNDKLRVAATVDLKTELQPEFSRAGCRVVKPTKFCVPTTKRVVAPGSSGPPIVGQPLRDDYVCYLVKCPNDAPIPDKLVADQFGQRPQGKYRPFELCVPARKGAPPCAPSGGKQCGGVCPDDAAGNATACRFDDALRQCTCAPQACGGKPDRSGQCGGACPDPAQFCRTGLDAAGRPACLCQEPPPPPCGLNAASGTCGGTCPNPADACIQVGVAGGGTTCTCQPPEPSCQPDTASGQCGGPCPPGLACALNPVINQCRCEPPPPQCGANGPNGQCGGQCPPDMACLFVSAGGAPPQCLCVTPQP